MNVRRTLYAGLMLCVMSGLCVGDAFAQGMIADIAEDVETEFGAYHPFPVEIEPDAEPYAVEPDFSNVVKFSDFTFSAVEESLLAANFFVVTPGRDDGGTGYKEIHDIYNECRERGIPIFVTTDAMLHTFHLCFDKILKTIEERRLFDDLHTLLLALFEETENQYAAAADSTVRAALERNFDFLIVAATLLDSTFRTDGYGSHYGGELDLIEGHAGFSPSPIFGYDEDYSQYIPRGHYTDSDSLRHYFLSMMWLGRMTFDAEDAGPTLSAILLVQAMENGAVGLLRAPVFWERVYVPSVFFVGKSDDINYYQYKQLAEQVYGAHFADLPVDDFAERAKLDAFIDLADDLPGPQITYWGQPKGFRLMGQRFVPDSYVLDHLVEVYVSRGMPKGLDVMSVLGSERAYEILIDVYGEDTYLGYVEAMAELKAEFEAYADSVWAQNMYWNWLYSLMPLLFEKGEGYPPFMQNEAWTDKDLCAALGSWAELRHDTILYAKQSGTDSAPPRSVLVQGYVEPNPHFYARLASLADLMITGLGNQNLLFSEFAPTLSSLRELLLSLQTISERELTNRPLTAEHYEIICTIGETIERIVAFTQWTEGPRSDDEEMPVIADVHTNPFSGTCLEEGVGYPMSIYVICNVEGELKVTRGASFSYYEFEWPLSDRLTDEKWIEMLQGESPPVPPVWVFSFLNTGAEWANPRPDFYYWQKEGLIGIAVTVEGDGSVVGDTVTIRVSSEVPFANAPTIEISPSSGAPFVLTDVHSAGADFIGTLHTEGMDPGLIGVTTTADIGYYETAAVSYRTSFRLHEREMMRGDTNGDGEIDAADAILVVNFILGLMEPTSWQLWVADMNDDTVVNVLDVVLLVNQILG